MNADTPTSLYDRIGGSTAVESLIEAFDVRVLADPIFVGFFRHTPLDQLQRMQKEFFCMALGGPVSYTGQSLAHAHHGRGIRSDHFTHFVGHLLETLRDIGIDEHDADLVIEHINTFANEITTVSIEGGACSHGASQSFESTFGGCLMEDFTKLSPQADHVPNRHSAAES